jgi:hypothetical protein
MIRIALVEDHVMFSEGLKVMLEQTGEFEVVCQHEAGSTFEELCNPEKESTFKLSVFIQSPWISGTFCFHKSYFFSGYYTQKLIERVKRAKKEM